MATGGAPAPNHTVRFGEFQLDLSRQTLSRRDIRLKLQNQPYRVLVLLIQRAPHVVSRDEIRRHIWGDSVHIDIERNVNFCIRQIRGVLLDSAVEPRFIETLPREGYRFLAPVDSDVTAQGPNQNGPAPVKDELPSVVPVKPSADRRWRKPVITLASVLIVAWLAVWLLDRDVQWRVSAISPVTSYPGDERDPSVSPDGQQIAFSWDGGNGQRHIYVKVLGQEPPVRLTDDSAEDRFPSWSPDGKQIAFMRRRTASEFEIILIPAIGGPERMLQQVRIGSFGSDSTRMMAWSPDGKWLCFTSELGSGGRHSLFLLAIDSGRVRPFYANAFDSGGDSSPAFSTDGHWLAFAHFTSWTTSEIRVQRLTDRLQPAGKAQLIANTSGFATTPVWSPDSQHVLFLDYGGTRISQAKIGGAAKLVYLLNTKLAGLTTDKSGMHLISAVASADEHIEVLPLQGLRAAGASQPFVLSTANEGQPRFSPDGRSIAFRSDRSGKSEIWLADPDGKNPRQLTHIGAFFAGYPKWSIDSKFIIFHARVPDAAQVYSIRIEDGVTRQITHDFPGFADASFSLDGTAAYMIRDEPSAPRLYRVSLTSLSLQPLLLGCCAMEAPGRGLLLYAKFEQRGIYARSLSGDVTQNPEIRLLEDYVPLAARFAPFEDGIYYVGCTTTGQPSAFRFYSFATNKSVDIAPTPANYSANISISPDRKRLAYTTRGSVGQDLVQFDLK